MGDATLVGAIAGGAGDARTRLLASLEEDSTKILSEPRGAAASGRTGSTLSSPGWPQLGPWPAYAPSRDPSLVVTISDRKVRLPGAAVGGASLYQLCRQWVQNEPELQPPPPPQEGGLSVALPPLLLKRDSAAAPEVWALPEVFDAGEQPDTEALLEHHTAHWRELRRRLSSRAASECAPYATRLRAVVAGATGR